MQIDQWEDAGPFLYRNLPEARLSDFFSEEREMLRIERDAGGWWLNDSRSPGAARHADLDQAKADGDATILKAEARMEADILAEAGLQATEWTVSYRDGLRFDRIGGSLGIVADDAQSPSWSVYDGDDVVIEGAATISMAVAAASVIS